MSKFFRSGLWFVLLLAVGLILLFRGTWQNNLGDEQQIIRVGLEALPLRLDPRFATDATSSRINRLLYQSLVDFDERSRFVPSIASWEQLSSTHYRFSLKEKGFTFHDGSPVTVTDVIATYRSVLDPQSGSPHRHSISMIESIEQIDQTQFDFFLNRADPFFPGYLVLGILPAAKIEQQHDFGLLPIGSGEFEFVAGKGQESLRIKRRSDAQVIEFLRVPSPEVRALKLASGEIDLLQNDLQPELEVWLQKQEGVEVLRGEGTAFAYLGFNFDDPLMAQLPIRQAIAYAIDREAIIRSIFAGAARPAASLFPAEHWAAAELPVIEFCPECARALLQQQGYNADNPLRLSWKTSINPFRLRLATLMQRQLFEVGIQVDLQSYDWGTFYGDVREGRFQMFSLMWVGIKSPDIFEYIFHSRSIPPNGANRGRYRSLVVDMLLDEIGKSDDLAFRTRGYQKIQEVVAADLPYIALWHENHFAAWRDRVTGYQLAADGNYDALNRIKLVSGKDGVEAGVAAGVATGVAAGIAVGGQH